MPTHGQYQVYSGCNVFVSLSSGTRSLLPIITINNNALQNFPYDIACFIFKVT